MILSKVGLCCQSLIKVFSTKFHRNPSSASRTDMRTHGRIDMTTVILAIRYYANVLKNNALRENQSYPSVRLSVS